MQKFENSTVRLDVVIYSLRSETQQQEEQKQDDVEL